MLGDGEQYTKTSASEVTELINKCKNHNLVAILEIHDATGSDSTSSSSNSSNITNLFYGSASTSSLDQAVSINTKKRWCS